MVARSVASLLVVVVAASGSGVDVDCDSDRAAGAVYEICMRPKSG